ncbi:MAG: hypothetical protein ACRC1D_00050 [Culicoidibacterales bacterium]
MQKVFDNEITEIIDVDDSKDNTEGLGNGNEEITNIMDEINVQDVSGDSLNDKE